MPAPDLISTTQTTSAWDVGDSGTPKATPSISVQNGDRLVAVSVGAFDGAVITPSGGGLTWTEQQTVQVTGYTFVTLWTASANTTTSFAVTFARAGGGTSNKYGGIVFVWRNASGIGASAQATGSGTPSLTLSTTQANSALIVACGDKNATAGTAVWLANAGAVTEEVSGAPSGYRYGVAHHVNAGAIGAYALGQSSPTGQLYSIAALEVKGTVAPSGWLKGRYWWNQPYGLLRG